MQGDSRVRVCMPNEYNGLEGVVLGKTSVIKNNSVTEMYVVKLDDGVYVEFNNLISVHADDLEVV